MPSIHYIILASLAAVGALARPAVEKRQSGYCLSDADAQQVATNYGTLIANYTKPLADAALSPYFTDYSESVNSLINGCPQGSAAIALPLLSPTFSNLTQFELGQGQQAPINFEQLDIWHDCSTVTIRWMTNNTAPIPDCKPVVGMIVMNTCEAPAGNEYPYYIDTVYSEFDSGAWLQNIQDAGFCPSTTTTSTTTSTPTPTASTVYVTATAYSTSTAYATVTATVY